MAGLALLGRVIEGGSARQVTLALGLAVLGGAVVLAVVERGRHRASPVARAGLDLALVVATAFVIHRVPPTEPLRALSELWARERATQLRVISHQVYAAYRRMDRHAQRRLLERAEVYEGAIREAAAAFGLEPELLVGIAAAESSFAPRPSRDGGRGLFQVTAVPAEARRRAREALGVEALDPLNQKHNAFLAAATLAVYAREMRGDVLLTLLAYNIGPHNGGLSFAMRRYGAHNFAQVQPYLQRLPREYPIRVLAAALSYRVWRRFRELPPFEEGPWAERIQALGIPGLEHGGRIGGAEGS